MSCCNAFDRNYDYGPCIGVTRLERWERAQAMGLNPPLEVSVVFEQIDGQTGQSF
jgi:DNA polymerase delta subunit 4